MILISDGVLSGQNASRRTGNPPLFFKRAYFFPSAEMDWLLALDTQQLREFASIKTDNNLSIN